MTRIAWTGVARVLRALRPAPRRGVATRHQKGNQPACKPGSVRRIAPRGRPFIWDACRQTPRAINPGGKRENAPRGTVSGPRAHPYLILLPVGFALPPLLPEARCALTAPFHPYPPSPRGALSVAVCFLWHCPWGRPRRPLAATVSSWSPDFPPPVSAHRSFREGFAIASGSGRPAGWSRGHKGFCAPSVKPIAAAHQPRLGPAQVLGKVATCPKHAKSSSPAR